MDTGKLHTDNDLLQHFTFGDMQALEQLFLRWYPQLVIFSEKYCHVRGDAEEIVSEAFLKAWQAKGQFASLPRLKSYIYTVVRNASLDAIRRANARSNRELYIETQPNIPPPGIADEVEMMRAEVIGALYAAIEQLPERPREIILLTYREGLSTEQIAAKLGISASTIRSHRAKAIQLLKGKRSGNDRYRHSSKYPILQVSSLTYE